MSGLGAHFPGFGPGYSGQVAQNDIDQYYRTTVDNPVVSNTWVGTAAGGTSGQSKALVLINKYLDHPRNLLYSVVGTNDVGGSWTIKGADQFGSAITETVGFGTAAAGTPAGSAFGTAIFARVDSGTFTFAVGSAGNGSAQLGVGTLSNGSAQSNWFGLLTKIAGTGDVKMISWVSSATPTTLNAGTAFGTLINTSTHSFQGTSGVATTDHYKVLTKSTYDNTTKGTMCAL